MAAGAVLAVGVTAYQIYANNKASKAQESAANAQGEAKRQQAMELMARFEMNARSTRQEGEIFKSRQIEAYASSGVQIDSGATLLALEQTQDTYTRQIEIDRMEATSQANALYRGQELDIQQGQQAREIGKLNNYNILFSNASKAAGAYA